MSRGTSLMKLLGCSLVPSGALPEPSSKESPRKCHQLDVGAVGLRIVQRAGTTMNHLRGDAGGLIHPKRGRTESEQPAAEGMQTEVDRRHREEQGELLLSKRMRYAP
mmetsp:Transcript_1702/g.3717  ORF Transcript_1702/g.3717 Transcript_1702/m.3717 type:complete len:107 (-) Transcript_1702:37-357(-)